ncbi:Restriction endonuclease [Candidatus Desulfarcum epimagneticum]|uniref:Restriction endonuclease n=1 Tax=uncultured Desulfobacteraceae bacterium TaxID=218296 RepID=A0A484HCT3_9BACT|nr:Restriction endonuclease [uncultured Desulfobacteraceae bacterium]
MNKQTPYNPLDKANLGESVADALLRKPQIRLSDVKRFAGAGIYAVYFGGDFPPYAPISSKGNGEIPIYVGKAVPPGARKGGFGLDADPGAALYKRLKEHSESIEQAANINPDDFSCRYLSVDDIWIPLGEALLIAKFCPLWNKIIDGFGNHDPGKGRYKQARSRWDTLHPGRSWAIKCQTRSENADQIITEVEEFLKGFEPN